MTGPAGVTFLDPKVLARIDDLELLARTVVDGFINGLHRSPYLGRSMDFAEPRAYLPGDDIRRIDWRVYGRTDRFFVKEFEADTNTNFSVLLDTSRSMAYGSAGITKLDYARYLAACLTYFSRQQRDRVGLVTFDRDVVTVVPPSAKHLERVLHELGRVTPGPGGALGRSLLRIAETVRRRYERGRRNFFAVYRTLADVWRIYDASPVDGPRLVATGGAGRPIDPDHRPPGVHAGRIWPLPRTTYLKLVSCSTPTGPRACSRPVEMPTSAPMPNSPPSAN